MRFGPRASRAASSEPPGASSRPRCAPSAPISTASQTSSLMISFAPAARQMRSISAACARRKALVADLLRYCTNGAPPSSAALTSADSRGSSGSSRVTAQRPLSFMSGFIGLFFVPRPEQTIRNELSHARTKAGSQCAPGIFLSAENRLGNIHTRWQSAPQWPRPGCSPNRDSCPASAPIDRCAPRRDCRRGY